MNRKGQIAGIVIRTAFNNQGWAGPCKSPFKDLRCYQCIKSIVFVNWGKPIEEDQRGFCKGESENNEPWCWEQILCAKYFWRNVLGKWRYAQVGMPVYFVYTEPDHSLTLWGKSVIDRIENDLKPYPTLYFKPFEPLPQDRWVKRLSGEDLTGRPFLQGRYRYLDDKHEAYLASLVEGKVQPKEQARNFISPEDYETLNVRLKRSIIEKLGRIADKEGREVEEIIREAVAKLIRNRES